MKKTLLSTFASLILVLNNCVFAQNSYQESIRLSSYPKNLTIFEDLVSISDSNDYLIRKKINGIEHILVLTWKQNISFYKNDNLTGFYNTGDYEIWVTVVPELIDKYKSFDKDIDLNLRLKKLLGLPPSSNYSYFVEIWVSPEDMFRPCPDKEIYDSKCNYCFPSDIDSAHISWINQNRINRYYNCDEEKNYPWTQLGYTYDWDSDNTSHIGLSEFVIKKNSQIKINRIFTTDQYLDLNKNKKIH